MVWYGMVWFGCSMCRISALYLGIKELVLTYLAVTVSVGDVEGPGFGKDSNRAQVVLGVIGVLDACGVYPVS